MIESSNYIFKNGAVLKTAGLRIKNNLVKNALIKIIAMVMFISLYGCYVGFEPGYDGQSGGGGYEPPPIAFDGPPDVIVLPDTDDVYVVPNISIDLFFWNGWWWRPWEGRWYRSQYFNQGWGFYNDIPSFYFDIDPGWRGYYRDRNWYGHRWDYQRIPNQQLQQNWKSWQNNRHWEKQGTWGVQRYQPRPQQQRQELRQQRQQRYQQRPEVQQRQQQRQEQKPLVQQPQRSPQAQPPRQEPQEKVPQSQRQQPQVQQPRQEPQDRVQQPQRQEQKPQADQQNRQPQAQQPRQEPRERVQQPQRQEQEAQAEQTQRYQSQERRERTEGERGR